MTSTITLLCPEGIVLAADMRATIVRPYSQEFEYVDGVKKIYRVKKKTQIGISCWGLAVVQGRDILPYLAEFDRSSVRNNDTVDSIAEKLKVHLEDVSPPLNHNMGFHVAGYVDSETGRVPHLRHVFRSDWHEPGEFTNEDCHIEYHLAPYGDKVSYRKRKDYPILFNGDNLVANALFNFAPMIRPYYNIVPHLLSLSQCIELAKLVISTSIQRLNYFFDIRQFQKIPPTVGGGVKIAKITETEGFKWV